MNTMLPALPGDPADRDRMVVASPRREVVEIRTTTQRVLHIIEPITVGLIPHALRDHTDVSQTDPTDGQAVVWNATTSQWEPRTQTGGGGGGGGVTDHGALTGLSDDDHPQYYNTVRLDSVLVAYATTTAVTIALATKEPLGAATASMTAHLATTDPHPQYATDLALSDGLATKENTGVAATAVAAHVAAGDPHPQYATDTALTTGLATKENTGVAAAAVAAHVAAGDPHPQYATDVDVAGKENTGVAAAAVAAHVAAGDPHPQYATDTDLTTGLAGKETAGAAAAAVAAHVALPDPHGQYATDSDLTTGLAAKENTGVAAAGLAAHVAAGDPHPQYSTDTDLTTGLATKENTGVAAGLLSTHVAAGDPHAQYALETDVNAALALKAALTVTDAITARIGELELATLVEPYFATEYGIYSMTGRPLDFLAPSTWGNSDHSVSLHWVPAGKPINKVAVAIRTQSTYSATGTPAQVKIYNTSGVEIGASPDDPTMFLAKGWSMQTLTTPIAAQSTGRFVYIGVSGGGFSGHSVAWPSSISDWPEGTSTGLLVGRRRGFYSSSGAGLPASFNPATYGTVTSYIPLLGLVA